MMSRALAWFFHLVTLLVAGTGLVYGWMRYLAEPEDEFALVNHPLQPELQSAHLLVAPLLVFACGLIWREHAWARLRAGFPLRRRGGVLLAALLLPMIASGYLLQTGASGAWRTAWIWLHVGSSCLWTLVYVLHQFGPRMEVPDFEDEAWGAEPEDAADATG